MIEVLNGQNLADGIFSLGGVLNFGILAIAAALAYLGLDSPASSDINKEIEDVCRVVQRELRKVERKGLLKLPRINRLDDERSSVRLSDGWLPDSLLVEVSQVFQVARKRLEIDESSHQSPHKINRPSRCKRLYQSLRVRFCWKVLVARRADLLVMFVLGLLALLLQVTLTLIDAFPSSLNMTVDRRTVCFSLLYFVFVVVMAASSIVFLRRVARNDIIENWAKSVIAQLEHAARRERTRRAEEKLKRAEEGMNNAEDIMNRGAQD